MIDTFWRASYQGQLGRMKKSAAFEITAISKFQFGLTNQNKSVRDVRLCREEYRDVEMAAVFV